MLYRITTLVTVFFCVTLDSGVAQNLQLHYEASAQRHYPNAFLESFTFDDWGSTYWFVTMDFTDPFENGSSSMTSAYGELARYFNFGPFQKVNLTLQYNDGIAFWGPMGRAWLAGVSLPLERRRGFLQTDVLIRMTPVDAPVDGQLTFSWMITIGNRGLVFTGYWDTWSETEADDAKHLVVLSEPQLWYPVWQNLDLGLGGELGYNFPSSEESTWQFYPDLSLRWNFTKD